MRFHPIRRALCLALTLALIVTGQALADARAAQDPAGRMVICAGGGPVTVALDARGKPAGRPHFCPDFALHLLQGLEAPETRLVLRSVEKRWTSPAMAALRIGRSCPPGIARGPPPPA